jgi:hypothetical protein
MTPGEINRLVNYIGVNSGYLGDFNYRTHQEFYLHLDLDIDPNHYQGTTRERFIQIVERSYPEIQARIIRGILDRYPVGSSEMRTQKQYDYFMLIAERLENSAGVPTPSLQINSEIVHRAINDAEALLNTSGATSGVDRVHTALHGYLQAICSDAGISYSADTTMNQIYRVIREQHPALQNLGHRGDDINSLLRSFSQVLDVLNPIRNRASVAHPNENLLEQPEAMLVTNGASQRENSAMLSW